MKIIKVKDQVEGGKEALKVFKEALDNGVKVFGLATVVLQKQHTMN